MSGELAAERWSPVQRAETVLLSVLSLLDDAEVSSPANVDAAVTLRKDPARYRDLVRADRDASTRDIPAGFVMPTHETAFCTPQKDEDAAIVWEDSDVASLGGSDSDFGAADGDSDFGSAGEDEDEEEDEEEDENKEGDEEEESGD